MYIGYWTLNKYDDDIQQDKLPITLKPEKKTIMKNRFRAKKILYDYHKLDRTGYVTLIRLCTGHNRLSTHMHRG